MKKERSLFEWIFIPLALVSLSLCAWRFHAGVLVTLCAMLGVVGSTLNGTGRKVCYFFLLASAVMYAYISFTNRYYGEAILSAVYSAPLFLYSILRWFKPGGTKKTADVFHLRPAAALRLGGLLLAGAVGYGFALRAMGSHLPFLNAVSTAVAVAANYLSARRMKEQWYAQLASNAALIIMWLIASGSDQGNVPLLVENILFVVSNIRGAIRWTRLGRMVPAGEDAAYPAIDK